MGKKAKKSFLVLATLAGGLMFGADVPALTFYEGVDIDVPVTSSIPSRPVSSPHAPQRYNYMKPKNYLPTAKREKPCVALGQARCLKKAKKNMLPKSRYTNRLAEQNSVHPLLRRNYKYKYTQNF